jgi:ABC-type multidrug transport system fused ATPase/permease subunit
MSVLATTRLGDFVRESGGIDAVMNAQQLSSGQKQLFSLARALLRQRVGEKKKKNTNSAGGLLLIDELNTRLDEETDSLIQSIVDTEFSAYTVVMIAHNLGIVMNMCNRVLVLDRGELVEVGDPKALVAFEQSHFSKLYHSIAAEDSA